MRGVEEKRTRRVGLLVRPLLVPAGFLLFDSGSAFSNKLIADRYYEKERTNLPAALLGTTWIEKERSFSANIRIDWSC